MFCNILLCRALCGASFVREIKLDEVIIRTSNWKSQVKFSNRRYFSAYEGSGASVAFVMNSKQAEVLTIKSVQPFGFELPNGSTLVGSMIMFPHTLMAWNIQHVKDLDENSLCLFSVIEPQLDILVLGYGNKEDYTPEVRQKFSKYCKNLGIKYEALPTLQACGIFNFLSLEKRFVAGAFIPPSIIDNRKLKNNRFTEFLDDEEEKKNFLQIGSSPLKQLK